jgi:membrane fusion protein, multidrug efflux system
VYRFTQLQAKKAGPKDSTFTIAFGNDVYPKPGTLSLVDRAVDPQTGTLRARLVFPNADHLLRAGMNTTVRVLNNSGQPSVIIPYKAVSELLGEYFVYVVGDSSKVTQKKIKTGRQLGADIIVKEGLNGGEKIVIQGIQNLREGTVVNIQQPGAAPAQK